jgi:hypothetical protein
LGVAAFGEEGRVEKDNLRLPLVLDFTNPKMFAERNTYKNWAKLPGHSKWWYTYRVSEPQGRVFQTEEYFEKRKGSYTREYPVSACADLTLEIGSGDEPAEAEKSKVTWSLRIPDPSYVEPLPFPRKGSITTHTVCGADISIQPSQAASTFAIVESIAKQVEAIWRTQNSQATGEPKQPTAGSNK